MDFNLSLMSIPNIFNISICALFISISISFIVSSYPIRYLLSNHLIYIHYLFIAYSTLTNLF